MERASRATERAYAELQQAYDFYNQRLFDGQLPDCLITFQRGRTRWAISAVTGLCHRRTVHR